MSKKVILISGSINTKNSLLNQIRQFIPQDIRIEAYASDEGINPVLEGDLLIVSSKDMKDELDQMNIQCNCEEVIICERSINFDYIDQVADLPVNEEVLLVNDEKDTTESAINDLIEIGLNHVRYYPYYPGISDYKRLKTAITPGEPDKVPACVARTINLGPRIIDINTLYNIVEKLELYNMDTSLFTKGYMNKIINVSQRISGINNKVSTLNDYLNNIVDSLSKGILVYDEDGYIKYANEEVRRILFNGIKDMENRNIKNIFDVEMLQYFISIDTYENKIINVMGTNLKISKFHIPNSQNIVVTTNREDQDIMKRTYNEDHVLKGHIAKYDFEDIIGEASSLNDTKKLL